MNEVNNKIGDGLIGERLSVVILTHNRAQELMRTLARMSALPERPPLIVVDNGSIDDTPAIVKRHFPQVKLVALRRNMGAAARNVGVEQATTPYVAFCDDDTWWAPGSFAHAVGMLDTYPRLAVLSARILVGKEERDDPACMLMARSPLRLPGLPGHAVLGFLAGASVFRRDAFLEAGGYEPNLFIGGEEGLLAIDLAARGWAMVYVPELVVHHHPSLQRDTGLRRKLLARNAIWIAWLRLSWRTALRQTLRMLDRARRAGILIATAVDTLRGLPWALRNRRVVPLDVESMYRKVQH
jgi:GT2 family glycosyltransferase